MNGETIRVFLVDDHEIVRRGVGDLLSAEADIEVVGEAATAAQARSRVGAIRPDVALLDVRLPDGSGIDVCRDLLSADPGIRCIMLTAYDDDEAIYAAVMAGASGYIIKDIRGGGLIESVRKVAAGHTLMDPSLKRRVALIADGLTNRQIGERLSLAEKTVKNYVSSMLSKLGLQRRTQAVAVQLETRAPHPPRRG